MEGKIAGIVLLCLLLAWLPEGCWQRGWNLFCRLWALGRRRRERGLLYRGYALQRALGETVTGGGFREEAPEYKFYTELYLELIRFNRTYGAPLKEPLRALQEHLSRDIQFERRVGGIRRESLAQFVLMSAIIWFFTVVAGGTFELPRNVGVDALMALLQGVGWFCFYFFDGVLKKIHLRWFGQVARPLYSFDSLLKTGLSCGEMIRISGVGEALDVFEKIFSQHHLRLEGILSKWRERGVPLSSEWKLFLQEIWALAGDKCETYAKCLQVVKFLVLVLFFLSSYFVYLSSLFGDFL